MHAPDYHAYVCKTPSQFFCLYFLFDGILTLAGDMFGAGEGIRPS